MPEVVALALPMHALVLGHLGFGISVMLAFYTYPRTGEVLTLRTLQSYLDAFQNLIIALAQSKSGKRRGEG